VTGALRGGLGGERTLGASIAGAAALLALAAARTWWAESAYTAGLGTTASPAEDVPGRLERYEEARRRDPSEPLYALRAGQIRLGRAGRTEDPGARREELLAAAERLRESVRLFPLDSQAHAGLAQALAGLGDDDGAIRHADAALLLGPRRPATYEWAIRWFARRWERARDDRCLARLLRTALRAEEAVRDPPADVPRVDAPPGARTVAQLLGSLAGPTAEDVARAVGEDPESLRFAARGIREVRPLDAERLERLAERAGGGGR